MIFYQPMDGQTYKEEKNTIYQVVLSEISLINCNRIDDYWAFTVL